MSCNQDSLSFKKWTEEIRKPRDKKWAAGELLFVKMFAIDLNVDNIFIALNWVQLLFIIDYYLLLNIIIYIKVVWLKCNMRQLWPGLRGDGGS